MEAEEEVEDELKEEGLDEEEAEAREEDEDWLDDDEGRVPTVVAERVRWPKAEVFL